MQGKLEGVRSVIVFLFLVFDGRVAASARGARYDGCARGTARAGWQGEKIKMDEVSQIKKNIEDVEWLIENGYIKDHVEARKTGAVSSSDWYSVLSSQKELRGFNVFPWDEVSIRDCWLADSVPQIWEATVSTFHVEVFRGIVRAKDISPAELHRFSRSLLLCDENAAKAFDWAGTKLLRGELSNHFDGMSLGTLGQVLSGFYLTAPTVQKGFENV